MARTRSKYGATPTTVDGIRFASKREAARYRELRLLEKAGEISELELHPGYRLLAFCGWNPLYPTNVGRYFADFRYVDAAGKWHVEDAKGVKTAIYRLKKKMVEATYGITIEEV